MSLIQKFLDGFSGQVKWCQVYQHQMVVCTIGYDLDATVLQTVAQCLCVIYNTLLICLEAVLQCLFEAYGFCCDDMHQRSTLNTREYGFVEVEVIFLHGFFGYQDHTASRSAQCFVCRSGNDVCIVDRAWMKSCCHQTCDMCHIYHQICTAFVCDLTETWKINGSRISTCTGNDHFRFALHRDLFYFVIINESFVVNSIRYDVEISTGKVDRASVCQMSAVIQVHTHHSVTRLKQCKLYCHVCLCTGVRLYVDILCVK